VYIPKNLVPVANKGSLRLEAHLTITKQVKNVRRASNSSKTIDVSVQPGLKCNEIYVTFGFVEWNFAPVTDVLFTAGS
jgi:hypothetical protein